MIEESGFRYLDKEDIRAIHVSLAAWASQQGEPVPSFGFAREHDIDALVNTPRQSFLGRQAYPTLAEKAAILFYTINKRQIFMNGNKRMSALTLLVFLGVNGWRLEVTPDELTAKALWLANTSSLDFPRIKSDLVRWIEANTTDKPYPRADGAPGSS